MRIIIKLSLSLFLSCILLSCSSPEIQDGKYCADIEVHNWKNDKDSNYKLQVEVENNQIVKIYWSNGGYLDETHFNPSEAELNKKDKTALFEDDRERMFLVKLLENDNCE